MPNKVTWKKGMRLTTELFNAMDAAHYNALSVVAKLASAGQYGLFPASKPFELSININSNTLEVTTLRCSGITRKGQIIAIDFDSHYSNTFDTRVIIPDGGSTTSYLLVVKMHEGKWRELNETMSESLYSFELIEENRRIEDDCLPIGCIVNEYGWRLNETDFVPPCLYLSAHYKYEELLQRAVRVLKTVCTKCLTAQNCVATTLLLSSWTAASNACQILDKERAILTPARLYSVIQQFVSSFLIGCTLDSTINLENKDVYAVYTQKEYDLRNIYRDIDAGVALCEEISVKMDRVCDMAEENPPRPQKKEEPKPTPPRPDTHDKYTRKGWEGLEI